MSISNAIARAKKVPGAGQAVERTGSPFLFVSDGSCGIRTVLGVVLEPGENYTARMVLGSERGWQANYTRKRVGLGAGVRLLQSRVLTADQMIHGTLVKKGTWVLLGLVTDDALWRAIKSGQVSGWSARLFEVGAAR